MRISFSGSEAEHHRLEAYEGLKSLDGIVRVATIAAHYAATNEVRFRAPYSPMLQVQLSGVKNGSFEFIFDQISKFADRVLGDAAKRRSEALLSKLVSLGTGQDDDHGINIPGTKIPDGDLAAMSEASESALISAHRWIDDDDKTISIIDGDDKVQMNSKTKDFVTEEIVGEVSNQDVSVAALNVNNRSGRVYMFDLGRTVPYAVSRDAESRTVANLSTYLRRYAQGNGDRVNIRFTPIKHNDGRLKKIIIYDCFDVRNAA
ncbi:hypothetical protein IFT67_07055 [Sphingomonas sp. CFBP 13728]|uniref:DUF7946 domain-containing protein n=1 Tax=Sphingomonas sp. CFBP 13728 TaxID=2775294 RepID=UPI001783E4A7|nr:hypothetical protein [Sphingomonas sp. CFBP 13728]MBD8618678.1 hypothetical protein [Sphingomonas sp. CFBP 13728]